MKILDYIRQCAIATTMELIQFKRDYPADFETLKLWAREQMIHNGIEITE